MNTSTTNRLSLWVGLLVGAAAGAAGTSALNVIACLDMAIRGRPASNTPERTVAALAKLVHLKIPGSNDVLAARLSGLGALSEYTAGIGIGRDPRAGLRARLATQLDRRRSGRHRLRPDRQQRTDDHPRRDRPPRLGVGRLDQRSHPALRIWHRHRAGIATGAARTDPLSGSPVDIRRQRRRSRACGSFGVELASSRRSFWLPTLLTSCLIAWPQQRSLGGLTTHHGRPSHPPAQLVMDSQNLSAMQRSGC